MVVIWDQPITLELALDHITAAESAVRDINRILLVSRAVLEDLEAIHGTLRPPEDRNLLFFRFIVCQFPLSAAVALGASREALDWLISSITIGHVPKQNIIDGAAGYLPLPFEGDSSIALRAYKRVPAWLAAMYFLAREYEDLGAMAGTFLEDAQHITRFRIKADPSDEDSILALAALASWAAYRKRPELEAIVADLTLFWNSPEIPKLSKTLIGQVFCTDAAKFTDRSSLQWADLLLDDFGPQLREHQRLQLLCISLSSKSEWEKKRTEILEEIKRLGGETGDQAASFGATWLFTLEARVSVINPLVHALVKFADLEGVLDVLHGWYGRPGATRCDANLLFVLANHEAGVAYLWREGLWVSHSDDLSALDHAIAKAFLHPVKVDGDLEFAERWSAGREGFPEYSEGAQLYSAVDKHYALAALSEHIGGTQFRSVLVYPVLQDGAASAIGRCLEQKVADEVSLGMTAELRPLKIMSIWPDHTLMTEFELEVLVEAGKRGGFEIRIFPRGEEPTANDFRRFYEDPEPDVLWVIGHGKFEPNDLGDSGLQFPNYNVVSGLEMGTFSMPAAGRRLLVLNICSAGESKTTGGISRIGTAQELVGAYQSVVAHRWAVDGKLALAFAALMAAALVELNPVEAYFTAIMDLRDPDLIAEKVISKLGKVAAIDRITPDDWENLLHWGCPVLMT